MLIDSHAHIYLDAFDADRIEVIAAAKAAGVERIYLPNVDSTTTDALHSLADLEPGYCIPMMGLHPCSVKEDLHTELLAVERHLASRPYAALGEIGIDLYWDKTFFKEQKEAFLTQCAWARDYDLPIVIHSRESLDILLDLIEALGYELRGIFHCFTGDLTQARRIIDLGFLMGIGGVITFKNSKLDVVLKEISLQHIVLETDAPYLTPHPYRGQRNESKYLRLIAQKLSEIHQIDVSEVAVQTTNNALELFTEL